MSQDQDPRRKRLSATFDEREMAVITQTVLLHRARNNVFTKGSPESMGETLAKICEEWTIATNGTTPR